MEENKDTFVPSYANEEERIKTRKEKDKKDNRKMIIIGSIVTVIIIGIFTLVYTLTNREYSKYKQYEALMDKYGFSQVYNNGEAKTKEKVTKSEAVKMILAAVYNVTDIEGIALPTEKEYSNAIWVEYAIKQGIVTSVEVNEKTADDRVKYKEVLVWLYNVKTNILARIPDTEDKGLVKDINAYNLDQKLAIHDLINSNVIMVNTKKINGDQKLYKGKLNELIVNFSEEYNTITVGDSRLNINKDKLPDNVDEYPYTLANVLKETYEYDFDVEDVDYFRSPIELYAENKDYYSQIKSNTEKYYTYLLNIDYETINADEMKNNLKKYLLFDVEKEVYEKYVEYVKNNHIKITGTATTQMPCVYYDGLYFRVRTKLDFKIESSDTNNNILYYDLEEKNIKRYTQKEYSIYIDTYMTNSMSSRSLFNIERPVFDMLVKEYSSIENIGE